jgi:hypothetical protein
VEKLYTDANPQLFMLAWNGLRSQGLITGNGDEHILQLVKILLIFVLRNLQLFLGVYMKKDFLKKSPTFNYLAGARCFSSEGQRNY